MRVAIRVLRRRPAFAATAVLMVALGIAATTAIYSVANAILFRPLPFPDPDRVVHLFESDDPNARPDNRLVTRPGNYYDWKARSEVFERMGAYAVRTVTLTSGADQDALLLTAHRVVDGYFETLGVAPVAGRTFASSEYEEEGGAPVAVLSERMPRRGWPGEDPIGRRVTVDLTRARVTLIIVGLVADARLKGPLDDVVPEMFWPMAQDGDGTVNAFVRTSMPPTALAGEARRTIAAVDPTIPTVRPRTLARVLEDSIWRPRIASVLFATFGSLALLLAALGLHGVLAYSVGRRTREIGIRMALGDRPGGIMRRIAKEGLLLVGIGIAIGLTIAAAAAPTLRALLTRDSLWDPPVIVAAAAVMIVTALISTIAPARRAATVDPSLALRAE